MCRSSILSRESEIAVLAAPASFFYRSIKKSSVAEAHLDLHGNACLVTGGTSGIGWSTAMALARKGAQLAIASRSGITESVCRSR
jgi:NADPH:quinone reductase-like Zn-dependent oxidoreductase